MQVLILAGVLALAASQSTTIDPSILINIFGTPPTNPTTRKPLEEVLRSPRNEDIAGHPTIKPSLLTEVFGTPPTPKSSRQTEEDVNSTRNTQGTRNVKVEGIPTVNPSVLIDIFGTPPTPKSSKLIDEDVNSTRDVQSPRNEDVAGHPTIKPSLLTEVFGTPPTPKSSRQTEEDVNSTRNTQDTRNVKVEGIPTVNPTVLIDIFGTPPTPKSSNKTYESESIKEVLQGNGSVQGVPTVKPSLLTEIFGTPSTSDSSRQGHGDRNTKKTDGGRRNVNVEGIPTVDPSLLIEVFGTAPTPTEKSSREGFEDITVKPTEGTATYVDKDGTPCQCVPYYLCDANNVGVDVNNASVTGWGVLDIRFGEDDNTIDRQCQESVEVCCAIPKDPSEVPPQPKPQPQPDPTKVKGCGYRNPQGLGVTITGGTGAESQFGEFPWVIALLDSRNSSYGGVGVLIHPQVVMTGAHIAQKYGPGELKIRAGEWDTQTSKEIYPFEERNVDSTIIHENFQPKSLKNDIALLRLDSPLEISEHINVICMPDYEEVFDSSKNCVANGWGKQNFGQSNRYAVILKKVEVDMVPYTRCNTLLKRTRLGHNFKLHNSFVCAGGEAGKDTCQGDGGAPLACPIGNNRYKLTGLVAWGIGCGQQDVPAVYTNVPLFRQWVDDKMADWGFEATSYRILK